MSGTEVRKRLPGAFINGAELRKDRLLREYFETALSKRDYRVFVKCVAVAEVVKLTEIRNGVLSFLAEFSVVVELRTLGRIQRPLGKAHEFFSWP